MRKSYFSTILWVVLSTVAFVLPARAATTIYVAPDGNDKWSGQMAQANAQKTDGPVATLERARDLVREKRTAGDKPRVIVAGGRYQITGPFTLGPEDSGVTYEAAPRARPVFSGGRAIREFEQADNALWRTRIPQVADGSWYFEQLFVNGRRAVRARTPNKFYSYMGESTEEPAEGKPGQFRRTTSVPADTIAPLRGLSQAEVRDVVLVAYHKWCITRRYLTAVDLDKNQILTTGEKLADFAGWPAGTRFHLENFKAAIDEPGDLVVVRRASNAGVRLAAIEGDGGRLPREPERNTATVAVSGKSEVMSAHFAVSGTSTDDTPAARNGTWSSSISSVSLMNTDSCFSRRADAQIASVSHVVEASSRRISRSRSPIMSTRMNARSWPSVPAFFAVST